MDTIFFPHKANATTSTLPRLRLVQVQNGINGIEKRKDASSNNLKRSLLWQLAELK